MKAAVLKKFGSQLVIEDVPNVKLGTGEVIVDVAAAPVLSYADEVFSGKVSTCSRRRSSLAAEQSGACEHWARIYSVRRSKFVS
jgi:hypothetical protein